MNYEIQSLKPSQALALVREPNSSLRDLQLAGYALSPEALDNPIEAASFDFNHPDERAQVFVAKDGQRTIGSLTFIYWKDDAGDKRGGPFWAKLTELAPRAAARARSLNPLACDVGGIVVHPNFRGQGIGLTLLSRAVHDINPSIIVGNTKTAGAVTTRRKLPGFRTFYCNSEITPGHEQGFTRNHEHILTAYLHDKYTEGLARPGHVFTYDGDMLPDLPNLSRYPEIIRTAFSPLVAEQNRVGERVTIMGPLLSIRNEILN